MPVHYSYFDLDDIPCRIARTREGEWGEAEMYKSGQGFVPGPKMEILFEASQITKQEFDAMILAIARRMGENTA